MPEQVIEQLPPTAGISAQENMEAVWRRRALKLSRRSDPDGASRNRLMVMVIGIGDERYAIELPEVVEVLPPVVCTRAPGAPAAICGVINVHGEIRPVINLRRMLGLECAEPGAATPIVLLGKRGRLVGLQADRVEEIRSIAQGEMNSAEGGQAGLPTRYVKGVTKDTLMLLNTDALMLELSMKEGPAK